MKTIKKFLLVICLPCLIFSQVNAFKPFARTKKNSGGPGGSNSAPINGGIAILLVGGLAFGAKKIYDSNKKKKENLTTP